MLSYKIIVIQLTLFIKSTIEIIDVQELGQCDPSLIYLTQPLSVTGQVAMSIPPELAIIQMGIDIVQPTAQLALNQSAYIMANAISAIKELGVLTSEISTTQLTLSEKKIYTYNITTQEYQYIFVGFEVIQTLTISTVQVGKAIDIVSAGIRSKMNSINSLSYDASNSTKQIIKNSLIVDAIKDANARAQRLVSSIGYQISGIKSISVSEPSEFVPSSSDIYSQYTIPTSEIVALNIESMIMQVTANLDYIIEQINNDQ